MLPCLGLSNMENIASMELTAPSVKSMHWLMLGAAGGSTGWCFVLGGSDTGGGTCSVCALVSESGCTQCAVWFGLHIGSVCNVLSVI